MELLWMLTYAFAATGIGAVLLIGIGEVLEAIREPSPRLDDRRPSADMICHECGKGVGVYAPTLTEAYSLVDAWVAHHDCPGVS